MPVFRYFLFVGGALLSVLFLVNGQYPVAPSEVSARGIDRSIIRIQSSQRWPEPVLIDTSLPVPPAAARLLDADASAQPRPADMPTTEAYAEMVTAAPKALGVSESHSKLASRTSKPKLRRRMSNLQPNGPADWWQP
jgi:hypothetical protein